MPPLESNYRRSKAPENADSSRRRTAPSSLRPKECSSSSRPRDAKPSKPSKHKETKGGGSDDKKDVHRRRERSGGGGSGSQRSNLAPPPPRTERGLGTNTRPRPRSQSKSRRRRSSLSRRSHSPNYDNRPSFRDAKSPSLRRSKSQQRQSAGSSGLSGRDSGENGSKPARRRLGGETAFSRSVGHDPSTNQFISPDALSAAKSLEEQQRRNQGKEDNFLIRNTASFVPPSSAQQYSLDKRRPKNTSAAAEHVDRLLEGTYNINDSPNKGEDATRPKLTSPSSTAKSSCSDGDKRNKDSNHKKKIGGFFSRVKERAARSRSRDRKRRDIDPWSDDHADGAGGDLKNPASSASKYATKGSSGSNGCSAKASMTGCSTPPPPPPRPYHRSASLGAVTSLENIAGSKSLESFAGPRRTLALPPANGVPPPPPAHPKKGRCSHPDLSTSSNSILSQKSLPPPTPPPPRRVSSKGALQDDGSSRSLFNSSSASLSNAHGNVVPSNDIVPATTSSAIVPVTVVPKPSNSNNNKKLPLKQRARKSHPVMSMAYTDPYGDYGLYTGEVDDESRPHGKGKMKYDNGIFYEGNWVHGKKDESRGGSSGDQAMTNATRERILSGFTSWKGQKKKDGEPSGGDMGTFVYGMEWVDLAGLAGKYTGHVDKDDVPNGKGVMRYEFGLVAEGDWIKGKLNDGAGGAAMSGGVAAQSVAGGMSVAPGMSVAGGAATVVSGLGMMSIGGAGGGGMMMGGHPHAMMGSHFVNAAPHTAMAGCAIGGAGGGGMMMGGHPHGMMGSHFVNAAPPAASLAGYHNLARTMMKSAPVAASYQQQHGIRSYQAAAAGVADVPRNFVAGERRG